MSSIVLKQGKTHRNPWIGKANQPIWIGVSIVILLAAWQLLITVQDFPAFILPSPLQVWERLLRALGDGTLLRHTWATFQEVILGLLIGSSLATLIGYCLTRSPILERLLSPYLVASQAIPTIAIAPLLVIWFGTGMYSKILICALTVFFPILVNTMVGLRAVPENLRDLMRSLRATRWQMLRYLEIPAALPVLLGGLRVGATLSVIGAVVGEFVGSDRGLGFLVNVGRGQYDTALVFVAILSLVLGALSLYLTVVLIEKHFLKWRKE